MPADDSGKKAGEFFTPRRVVHLIIDILDPQEGRGGDDEWAREQHRQRALPQVGQIGATSIDDLPQHPGLLDCDSDADHGDEDRIHHRYVKTVTVLDDR